MNPTLHATSDALQASLFMSVLSLVLGAFVLGGTPDYTIQTSPAPGQGWL
jgi:putative membrane protein